MGNKKMYKIYNKKYDKCEIFESYEYCAGSFLQWILIMNDWSMKDCTVQVLEVEEK